MSTDPQAKDQPTASAPAGPPATPAPAAPDDPQLAKAKLDLELAKVALEKERLGLTDQSERFKLAKGMVPDLATATVEKDALTASDKPSALSESLIQRAAATAVDDIADLAVAAVKRSTTHQPGGGNPPITFVVTTDRGFLVDGSARRDVLSRLSRVQTSIDDHCDAEPVAVPITPPYTTMLIAPIVLGALSALPGAITLATRLFAHQYTTSTYTGIGGGSVDLQLAGALISRVEKTPSTTVRVARLTPARDDELERQVLELATDVDGRLSDSLSQARLAAAKATHVLESLTTRRAAVGERSTEILAAWKDKVGKTPSAAGLTEDLALTQALEATVADPTTGAAEKKRLTEVLTAVRKRIEAVLKEVAEGSGAMGSDELRAMLESLDLEMEYLVTAEVAAKDTQSRADERVAELTAVRTAALDLIEALGTTDAAGDRLLDKASRGSVLDDPGTLVLFARLYHGGADSTDETKLGPDHRTTTFGATVEWALLQGDGTALDAGSRTELGYLRSDLSSPDQSTLDRIGYVGVARAELP